MVIGKKAGACLGKRERRGGRSQAAGRNGLSNIVIEESIHPSLCHSLLTRFGLFRPRKAGIATDWRGPSAYDVSSSSPISHPFSSIFHPCPSVRGFFSLFLERRGPAARCGRGFLT